MTEIPQEFICPITLELMVHPMATRHGQTFSFERAAILAWMEKSDVCPMTRKPLSMGDVINNNFLAKKIRLWKEQNEYPEVGCQDEDDKDSANDCSRDAVGVDDEVLILMYGTAAQRFQTPANTALPSSLQPAEISAPIERQSDIHPKTTCDTHVPIAKLIATAAATRTGRPMRSTLPARSQQNTRHQQMWFY